MCPQHGHSTVARAALGVRAIFIVDVGAIIWAALGETGGDLLSMTLNVGYAVSSILLFGFFLVTLGAQLRTTRYRPAIYWAVIVATSASASVSAKHVRRLRRKHRQQLRNSPPHWLATGPRVDASRVELSSTCRAIVRRQDNCGPATATTRRVDQDTAVSDTHPTWPFTTLPWWAFQTRMVPGSTVMWDT